MQFNRKLIYLLKFISVVLWHLFWLFFIYLFFFFFSMVVLIKQLIIVLVAVFMSICVALINQTLINLFLYYFLVFIYDVYF